MPGAETALALQEVSHAVWHSHAPVPSTHATDLLLKRCTPSATRSPSRPSRRDSKMLFSFLPLRHITLCLDFVSIQVAEGASRSIHGQHICVLATGRNRQIVQGHDTRQEGNVRCECTNIVI